MKIKALLTAIALAELATGIGLLLAPSTVAALLLGYPLGSGVPLIVARVAGLALVAIGLICWLEKTSNRGGSPTALLAGLLIYNGAVAVLLLHSYLVYDIGGIGLWPVVVLHLVLAAWLAACLRCGRSLQ
ncbi:MAG: hypothetical protein ABWY01_05415 [Pseudoxanthomonas sp.]